MYKTCFFKQKTAYEMVISDWISDVCSSDLEIKVAGSDQLLGCTATIGVSQHFYGAHGLEEALRQADAALYKGKAAGRNRIEAANIFHDLSTENTKFATANP